MDGEGFQGYENQNFDNRGDAPNQKLNRHNSDFSETAVNFPKKAYDDNALIHITNMGEQEAENRFSQSEVAQIKREFDKNSKDQIIGKRKLIEFFRFNEISDSYITNELFNIIKNSNRLNSPIDYQRFISFIAILIKGSRYEKLLLIFSIFGKGIPCEHNQITGKHNPSSKLGGEESSVFESESILTDNEGKNGKIFNDNGSLIKDNDSNFDEDDDDEESEVRDPRVTKEDMKLHISGTILSMVNVNFENGAIEGLKQQICRSEEELIDDALDILVEEIFDKYAISNKDDGLNFEEWCEWFTTLDGCSDMLMGPSQMQSHQGQNINIIATASTPKDGKRSARK